MNWLKRVVSSLIAVSLLFTLVLSGCANKEEANKEINTSTPASTADELNSKPVKLKWVAFGEKKQNTDKVMEEFNKKLSTKLPNTTLEMILVPGASYNEKTKMMIAGNDDFDIMWAADWIGDYLTKVNNGAFMPIDELINKYAPKIKETIPENILNAGLVNGKIYGLLSYQQLWTSKGITVRKSLIDKYGLDMAKLEKDGTSGNIKAVDLFKELEPFMEKAKAGEPNFPYVANASWSFLTSFIESTYEPVFSEIDLAMIKKAEKTPKIYNYYKTQDFIDIMDLARSWYLKGYIRKDVVTAKAPLLPQEYLQYLISFDGMNTIEEDQNQDAKIKKYGEPMYTARFNQPYMNCNAGVGTMNFINAKSNNPERAIKLLELINTDVEIYNLLCFGIEGQDYKKVENPKDTEPAIVRNDPLTHDIADWVAGNVTNSYGQSQFSKDIKMKKWNIDAVVSTAFGFRPNIEPIKDEIAKTSAVVNEYYLALFLGADKSYKTHYEEFIKKLDDAGAEKVINELNKQLDEYMITKK